MKLNHIDEIDDDTKEQEEYDTEDTTKENIVTSITEKNVPKKEDITQEISKNSDESEEGINIFLIYYIGIIIVAIFAIIVMYFLFT